MEHITDTKIKQTSLILKAYLIDCWFSLSYLSIFNNTRVLCYISYQHKT